MTTPKTYPKARIAMGNGDLIQVTDLKVTTDNSAKTVATLRRPRGAGITIGTETTTVTFNYVIDGDGAERDYIQDIRTGKIRQLRIKVPGETITVNGVYKKRDIDGNVDDAIKGAVEFVGILDA
jgi:hypothetical protein